MSLPYDLIETLFTRNPSNPEFHTDQTLIQMSKKYNYGKASFYSIAQNLYLFDPGYTYDNSTLNRINTALFEMPFRPDVDNYKVLLGKIEIALNFARKFIRPKFMLTPIDNLKLPENISEEQREALLRFMRDGSEIGKKGSILYQVIFNNSYGPKLSTIHALMPIHYKQRIIQLLEGVKDENQAK